MKRKTPNQKHILSYSQHGNHSCFVGMIPDSSVVQYSSKSRPKEGFPLPFQKLTQIAWIISAVKKNNTAPREAGVNKEQYFYVSGEISAGKR